jgi:hypothetical protein
MVGRGEALARARVEDQRMRGTTIDVARVRETSTRLDMQARGLESLGRASVHHDNTARGEAPLPGR